MTDTDRQSEWLSKPMRAALAGIEGHQDLELYGCVPVFTRATVGTLKALRKRGLIEASGSQASCDVRLTDAGRAALKGEQS